MQEDHFDMMQTSVRKNYNKLGTRTELKNINSFKFVEKRLNMVKDKLT